MIDDYTINYKEDFPLLKESPVAYLDNAATMQRPQVVLEAEKTFYEKYNANPLRGLYELGMEATDRYEEARETVRAFLHAAKSCEIIFTRNTTESINLAAYSYGLNNLKAGDEILVGIDSHRSHQLMSGKSEEICIHHLHINRNMRYALCRIDNYNATCFMYLFDDLIHRIHPADHIGNVSDCRQFCLLCNRFVDRFFGKTSIILTFQKF